MSDERNKQSQADKFREAAEQVETDDDEKRFDEKLKRLAKSPAKARTAKNGAASDADS